MLALTTIRRISFLALAFFLIGAGVGCKPMCPIESCKTRMVHPHSGQEFRGMPWYKKQKPRIGEKLKKPSKDVQKELNSNGGGGTRKN